ncbi:MAG: iron ABC transporter permease [Clostridia bacterium]|nr:iron ABC transporter permease [Clostridia bacterium]
MKNRRKAWIAVIGCVLLPFAFAMSIRMGSTLLSWTEFFKGLLRHEGYEKIAYVIWILRFPRALAAVLAGVGLSVCGLALQNITGNELAGPNIIGVNAGAGFFVIAGMYFLGGSSFVLPLFAFLGAFLTSATILLIGSSLQKGKSTIILAGIAVTALLNAGISLISRLDTDLISLYNDFAVGGFYGTSVDNLAVPFIMIALSTIVLMYFSRDIDVMMLGDEVSVSLGIHMRAVRLAVILSAGAAAGAVVSFAGLLGFVGLIVPHMAKKIFGIRTKTALLSSALLGAIVVLFADTIGRSIFPKTEIPVGIVMAFVGVPFFLYLIIRRRSE